MIEALCGSTSNGLNELEFYDLSNDAAVQGWTTIDVTRGGDGHPYVDAWWPDSHGLGYEHAFVNQASDILTVIGGGAPVVPLPDFADALDHPVRARTRRSSRPGIGHPSRLPRSRNRRNRER